MWELRRGEGRERQRQGRADVCFKKMQFRRRVQSLRESMVLNYMNEGGGSGLYRLIQQLLEALLPPLPTCPEA